MWTWTWARRLSRRTTDYPAPCTGTEGAPRPASRKCGVCVRRITVTEIESFLVYIQCTYSCSTVYSVHDSDS